MSIRRRRRGVSAGSFLFLPGAGWPDSSATACKKKEVSRGSNKMSSLTGKVAVSTRSVMTSHDRT